MPYKINYLVKLWVSFLTSNNSIVVNNSIIVNNSTVGTKI